jgi:hypothetical protein
MRVARVHPLEALEGVVQVRKVDGNHAACSAFVRLEEGLSRERKQMELLGTIL